MCNFCNDYKDKRYEKYNFCPICGAKLRPNKSIFIPNMEKLTASEINNSRPVYYYRGE